MPAGPTAERPPETLPQRSPLRPTLDTTGFADRPILLLGAGSGLGESLAVRLARTHQVIAGTRSPSKFEALKTAIAEDGGFEPLPLIADITRPDEFQRAFHGVGLLPDTKLHFMPVAAGGLEGLQRGIVANIGPLNRLVRDGQKIPVDRIIQATAGLKRLVLQPEHLAAAMTVNKDAANRIFDMLNDRGHIDDRTETVNTSSSISDGVDLAAVLADPERYQGPWFYYTIAVSKQAGVEDLRTRALRTGSRHLNIVAPELPDTRVGGVINGLEAMLRNVDPPLEFSIPKLPRGVVADATIAALMSPTARLRTLYTDESGVGSTRPSNWDARFVPYL